MPEYNGKNDILTAIRESVLSKVTADYLKASGVDKIVDLRCGIGSLGGYFDEHSGSNDVPKTIGIDTDTSKLENTKKNYDACIRASVTALPLHLTSDYVPILFGALSNLDPAERQIALQQLRNLETSKSLVHDYNDGIAKEAKNSTTGQIRCLRIEKNGLLSGYPCDPQRDHQMNVSVATIESVLERKLDETEMVEMEKKPRGLNRYRGVVNFGRVVLELDSDIRHDKHEQAIALSYRNKRNDFDGLFRTVDSTAREIGLDATLSILERCEHESAMKWLDTNLSNMKRTGNSIDDTLEIFYRRWLGIKPEKNGEIVERTDSRLVIRWWNNCPVLKNCNDLDLDTRVVCRSVYHNPYQAFLKRIDPRLTFKRDYKHHRPHGKYCVEIIEVDSDTLKSDVSN